MINFNIDNNLLLFYISIILSSWMCNFIALKCMIKNYNNYQKRYEILYNQLSRQIVLEDIRYKKTIQEFDEYQKNTFDIDKRQLTIRSNRVIENMRKISLDKQENYHKNILTVKNSLEKLIDEILLKI